MFVLCPGTSVQGGVGHQEERGKKLRCGLNPDQRLGAQECSAKASGVATGMCGWDNDKCGHPELRRRGGRRPSMGALKLHPCCILHLILGGHREVLQCPVVYQKGPFVASFRAGKLGRSTVTHPAHSSNSREGDGSALCLIRGSSSENLGAWPCQGAAL